MQFAMSTSGRWGLKDELHFIEKQYKRRKAFLNEYVNSLDGRFLGFTGARLHGRDRETLLQFCRAVPFMSAEKYFRKVVRGA